MLRSGAEGYAVFYFTITGTLGLYVMHSLPTWCQSLLQPLRQR